MESYKRKLYQKMMIQSGGSKNRKIAKITDSTKMIKKYQNVKRPKLDTTCRLKKVPKLPKYRFHREKVRKKAKNYIKNDQKSGFFTKIITKNVKLPKSTIKFLVAGD